jgi:hypothetical protein
MEWTDVYPSILEREQKEERNSCDTAMAEDFEFQTRPSSITFSCPRMNSMGTLHQQSAYVLNPMAGESDANVEKKNYFIVT